MPMIQTKVGGEDDCFCLVNRLANLVEAWLLMFGEVRGAVSCSISS